jgi:hypothetical protein
MGIEPPHNAPENNAFPAQGSAESGALPNQSSQIDGDLTTIINAWPTLPKSIRDGVLAMVRGAAG